MNFENYSEWLRNIINHEDREFIRHVDTLLNSRPSIPMPVFFDGRDEDEDSIQVDYEL